MQQAFGFWVRPLRMVVVVGLTCVGKPLWAQPDLPALRQQLAQARSDTARSRLLGEMGRLRSEEDPDSGLYFLHQSLRLAQRADHAVGQLRALCLLGNEYLYRLRDEGRALQYLTQARDLASRIHDDRHLAKSYQLLSIIAYHQRIGNPFELLAIALGYARKAGDWEVLCDIYDTGGDFYSLQNNFRKAETYCRLSMMTSAPHNLDRWVTAGLSYCDALEKEGKKAQALAVARQLDAAKNRLRQTDGPFVYANDMAQLAIKLKRYTEAETYLLNGLTIERRRARPDSLHLFYYFRNLTDLYASQRWFEKAYRWSAQLAEIRLWMQRTRQTRDAKLQMTELRAAVAIEKKEAELARLAARQQQQRGYLLGALLLTGLLVGFVVVLQRKQRRIERQREQLARLNATKDKLFALLAHDLRSPVASLANSLSLTTWGALSPEEFANALPTLGQRLHALQTTLDNLLNWALAQQHGLQPRPAPVLLHAVVERELSALRAAAQAKHLVLSSQIPATARLWADPDHLAIVARNLLQNAVKFTHPGGHVRMDYAEEGPTGRLDVTDDGIGIPPEHLPALFELTGRPARRGTAHESGTGLGLVLVYELVRLNGGHLRVKSEVNRGTTFSVTLPLAPAGAEPT
jgi:signal transduction histidine kinase